MLIVCPSCATSYMIEPASVGPTGRAVRCARCKATWFVDPAKTVGPSSVSAFVDSVIAEAEAEAKAESNPTPPPPAAYEQPPSAPPPRAADDMPGAEPPSFASEPVPEAAEEAPPVAPAADEPHFQAYDETAPVASPNFDMADSITVTDAPPLAPPGEHDGFYGTGVGTGYGETDDGENFVARRQRLKAKRNNNKKKSRWTAIILLLLAVNVALIGARREIVAYLPQTASLFAAIGLPVNLRHLEFENINIAKEAQDGVNILIIEGKIVNTAGKAVDVPRLRFAARNASGQEVYTWTMQPPRSILGPGERMDFTSRLAAPPADATDILVRFFTTQDAGSGMK